MEIQSASTTPDAPERARSPDWLALGGVLATIALHFVLQADGPNPWFIGGACLAWSAFVGVRVWQKPARLREWGFRADNLLAAVRLPLVFFMAAAAAMAAYAGLRGALALPGHPALWLTYPIWGVMQQFMALGIVVSNVARLPPFRDHEGRVVTFAALAFGAVHLYDWRIALAMLAFEALATLHYLRHRNLWPLGAAHGWLGALFYAWVLQRDLWGEGFGG